MSTENPSYIWKKQKMCPDCEVIHTPEYDCYSGFQRDATGTYVLIKVNFSTCRIELAVFNKDHEAIKIFTGRKCQDLYAAIFKYEKDNNLKWFSEKTHLAYLGKELKKAELALCLGNNAYFQE